MKTAVVVQPTLADDVVAGISDIVDVGLWRRDADGDVAFLLVVDAFT